MNKPQVRINSINPDQQQRHMTVMIIYPSLPVNPLITDQRSLIIDHKSYIIDNRSIIIDHRS